MRSGHALHLSSCFMSDIRTYWVSASPCRLIHNESAWPRMPLTFHPSPLLWQRYRICMTNVLQNDIVSVDVFGLSMLTLANGTRSLSRETRASWDYQHPHHVSLTSLTQSFLALIASRRSGVWRRLMTGTLGEADQFDSRWRSTSTTRGLKLLFSYSSDRWVKAFELPERVSKPSWPQRHEYWSTSNHPVSAPPQTLSAAAPNLSKNYISFSFILQLKFKQYHPHYFPPLVSFS